MAKNDAEIKLKINMPPPNEFKAVLAKTQQVQKDMAASWGAIGKDLAQQAQQAKRVMAAAKGTGFAPTVGHMYKGIDYNMLEAEGMIVGGKVKTAGKKIAGIEAAVASGELSEAEAVEKLKGLYKELGEEKQNLINLEKQYEDVSLANKGTGWIYEAVQGLREQIAEGEKLHGVMQAQEAEYTRLAEREREYREGLDQTSETYAQEAAAAQEREVYYKKAAAAQKREAKALGAKVEAAKEVLATGAEENALMAAQTGLVEQGVKAKEKSLAISDEVQLKNAKWVADEEKANNARVAAAKREADLAAEREKREALAAQKEREREEIEQFNMQLSLLNKDQLIKKLRELQKAREEASRAGDNETYKKRTREFMATREQMEKVNTQLNITRLAWTQQTQLANQFAGSLTDLVGRFKNFGEAAEKGEMDLTGLMGAAQSTGSAFVAMVQNGMSSLSALQLGLQVIQSGWNYRVQKIKEMQRIDAEAAKRNEDLSKTIRKSREEFELFDRERAAARGLKEQIRQYDLLHLRLEGELRDLEKIRRAELSRLALTQDAKEHEHAMAKEELNRRYINGEISREQFDEETAKMDRDFEVGQLDADVQRAQAERDAAEKAMKAINKTFAEQSKLQAKYSDTNFNRTFLMDGDKAQFLFEQYNELGRKTEEVNAAYEAARQRRASKGELELIANDFNIIAGEQVKIYAQMKPTLEKYFGEKITNEDMPIYFRKYMADMKAFKEAKAQADTAVKEAGAEWEAANVRLQEADVALEDATTKRDVEGVQIEDRYESGKKTREATREADKRKEKRAKKLQDLSNKADALTEDALKKKLEAARQARDNATNEHKREYAGSVAKMYEAKLKGRRKSEREKLQAAELENDLKQSEAARAAYAKLDLQGALNTMDDGRLSRGEVGMLLRQLKLARQADNKVAQELILGLVQEAMESKKMSAKYKREVLKAFER